ncbi:MAG: helix-turn-helix domain-containing protein [bacterium]
MSNSFDRSGNTTRTQTMNVSNTRVLQGFSEAMHAAIEQAETALTYAHAVGDDNVEEAEAMFEQLAAIAMNGLGLCTRRRAEQLEASENILPDSEDSSGEHRSPLYQNFDEPSPLLLGLDDSAKFLGVSRERLVALMDAGEFEAEFVGAELRLNMQDLDDYLQRGGAGRMPTPAVGVQALSGLSEAEEDFESIVARLFDE